MKNLTFINIRLVWEPVLICVPSMSNSDKVAIAKLACQLGTQNMLSFPRPAGLCCIHLNR